MLSTARLSLVPHHPRHSDAYAAFWAKDPGHFLRSIAPMRGDDAWTRLLKHHGHWAAFGYGPFLAFDQNNVLVAEVGYEDFHRGLGPAFDGVPEGLWKVDIDHQGKGIAGEAMDAITLWLDRVHAPPRTVCMIDPLNAASIKVAQRLGFRDFAQADYRDAAVTLFERFLPTA